MRLTALIVSALALVMSPAHIAAGDKSKKEAKEEVKKDKDAPDAIRCKRLIVTGSNIKKRKCRTNAEWARMAQDGKDDANALVDAANKGNTNGR